MRADTTQLIAAQRRALPPGELLYVQQEPSQNHRAGDLVDPVWGLLDMSQEGRGDFFPKLHYH